MGCVLIMFNIKCVENMFVFGTGVLFPDCIKLSNPRKPADCCIVRCPNSNGSKNWTNYWKTWFKCKRILLLNRHDDKAMFVFIFKSLVLHHCNVSNVNASLLDHSYIMLWNSQLITTKSIKRNLTKKTKYFTFIEENINNWRIYCSIASKVG